MRASRQEVGDALAGHGNYAWRVDVLAAEVIALRKDRERLDWLLALGLGVIGSLRMIWLKDRRAIDAAKKAGRKP